MSDSEEWEMIEAGFHAAAPDEAPEPPPPPPVAQQPAAPPLHPKRVHQFSSGLLQERPRCRDVCGPTEAVGLCASATLLHLGAGLSAGPLAGAYLCLFGAAGVRRRARFRRRYGIEAAPGQCARDCALYAFCAPCAMGQEARHASQSS